MKHDYLNHHLDDLINDPPGWTDEQKERIEEARRNPIFKGMTHLDVSTMIIPPLDELPPVEEKKDPVRFDSNHKPTHAKPDSETRESKRDCTVCSNRVCTTGACVCQPAFNGNFVEIRNASRFNYTCYKG